MFSTIRLISKVNTIGGMLGVANAVVLNFCYSYARILADLPRDYFLGGLIGNASDSTIHSCEVKVNITAANATSVYLGGIAGAFNGLAITSTTVYGTLMSPSQCTEEIIGGYLGYGLPGETTVRITQSKANVTIMSFTSTASIVGGLVGTFASTLEVTNVSVIVAINCVGENDATSLPIGGVVAKALGLLVITRAQVNVTIDAFVNSSQQLTAFIGGIAGNILSPHYSIVQVIVIVNIMVATNTIYAGGIVGNSSVTEGLVKGCGVLGTISIEVTKLKKSTIGGIAGVIDNVALRQNYFIGIIIIRGQSNIVVGALVGSSFHSSVYGSYALTNMSISGHGLAMGAVAFFSRSEMRGCYASINAVIAASGVLTFGGMIGIVTQLSSIRGSFLIGAISVTEPSLSTIIGGFVGQVSGTLPNTVISKCYVWGSINIIAMPSISFKLGGFIGSLEGSANLYYCITYVTLIAPQTHDAVGLFIGNAIYDEVYDVKERPFIKFSIAYVKLGGSLKNIRFVGKGDNVSIALCYCAQYPFTSQCIPLATLNTEAFLSEFDFEDSVQINRSFFDGNLVLQSVPALHTGSTISNVQFTILDRLSSEGWRDYMWLSNTGILNGYLYYTRTDYVSYCNSFSDCHGVGTSPVTAFCSQGWSSPPRNNTIITHDLHHCNIFFCRNSADCNYHGACRSGVCSCNDGYGGADCSQPICVLYNNVICGSNNCIPFAENSLTGTCMCQRNEYPSATGQCEPKCPVIGLGVCDRQGKPACYNGYSTASNCFEYDCSAATGRPCNKKGKCTNGVCSCDTDAVLLGGNCYEPCTTLKTTECINIDCGVNNKCSGRGVCMPTLDGASARCVCNADEGNQTHYGGPKCSDCEIGYALYENRCVKNDCLKCVNGECVFDAATDALVCSCPPHHSVLSGVCVTNKCGNCASEHCMSIPGGADPTVKYCICGSFDFSVTCYTLNCASCINGVCAPNIDTLLVECVCPEDTVYDTLSGACLAERKSNNTVVIAVPVVIISVIIIVAGVTVGVLLRKRCKKRENQFAEILEPSTLDCPISMQE